MSGAARCREGEQELSSQGKLYLLLCEATALQEDYVIELAAHKEEWEKVISLCGQTLKLTSSAARSFARTLRLACASFKQAAAGNQHHRKVQEDMIEKWTAVMERLKGPQPFSIGCLEWCIVDTGCAIVFASYRSSVISKASSFLLIRDTRQARGTLQKWFKELEELLTTQNMTADAAALMLAESWCAPGAFTVQEPMYREW
mmetsp:Transcript_26401/g.57600  ORF Transcript_26401/g.57600 Transcript_26401/m.57600 type:complete len:202 (+) Transcript_26401:173-778(+)|eukprot:CAMPEP_0202892128 /NCGR_PEP_ID=MMETSP1392-20130828/1943_1 /ASSEMBLY_ACC=CAM_ASM_000868 /TAXON_ID=225041 /ORGANISM="Chlamydomonas chlamydogama, Strain SAG 11-48b" /LENGTH=201 /DNA_ID=CAMNT_0049576009 /DNA_START=131 /DNA_END=733 /DNA_ORIENTATION=+